MNIKIITLVILTVIFLYKLLMEYLDYRSMKNPLPENVKDIYDSETYNKWRKYHGEKSRISIISETVAFIVDFLLLLFNVYALFSDIFPDSLFWGMFAVLLLNILVGFITLPLTYHDKINIEGKYGFNKMTVKTFWADTIKEFIISVIIFTLIGALFIFLHQKLGDGLIIAFAAALTLLMFMIAFLFPVFSKIFNKFTPLEDGDLKDKLTALLTKNGYNVRAIMVMDASKRSSKLNAYFTGFGKMKTIVLYDTLKEAMSVDEICAVFAHEMGHGLHKDTLKNQLLTLIQMLIISTLAWLTVRTPEIFTAFGFDKENYGFAIVLILSIEFALISPLFGMIINIFSRRNEYRADEQAVKEGYGRDLISALKVLAKSNYANLSPDPLVVKLSYSHPTLSQRFEAIERKLNKEEK